MDVLSSQQRGVAPIPFLLQRAREFCGSELGLFQFSRGNSAQVTWQAPRVITVVCTETGIHAAILRMPYRWLRQTTSVSFVFFAKFVSEVILRRMSYCFAFFDAFSRRPSYQYQNQSLNRSSVYTNSHMYGVTGTWLKDLFPAGESKSLGFTSRVLVG